MATWKKLAFYDEVGTTFIGLSDTPSSYTGQAGKYTKVNATADAIEFGKTEAELQDHAPKVHATSHKDAGSDEILLHELGEPTGNVNFNKKEAISLALDNQASDPASPVLGQVYFKTGDTHPYICTAV